MKRPRTLHQSLPGLRQLLAFFRPRLRGHRGLLVASALAMVAEAILGALEPWPLKFIFDGVLGVRPRGRSPALSFVVGLDATTVIAISAVSIIVIAGARALADYASTLGFARVANRVLAEVRGDLYRHLQGLSLSFHNKARCGDLLLRLMNDVNQLRDVAVTAVVPLLADALVLVSMIAVMIGLHWELAAVALALLPLFWLWTVRLTGRIRRAARDQRQREAAMAATAAETIGAIKVIQAIGLEGRFAEGFLRRNSESQEQDVRTARLTAALGRSVAFLIAASTALVLWYGSRLVLGGELTPGELLVFMTYLKNAFRPVRDLAKYAGRLVKATASGERVIHLFEQVSEVRDRPGAVPAPPFRGAIEFEGVDFEYEPGHRVLSRIAFRVEPGQHVALVGPSGIGKSTLASLILRLYDPTGGRIRIDGRDIREYRLASLRAQIGVVLQETLLFAATIGENIALGAESPGFERIESAARLANAHTFIERLPRCYDTPVGERGVTLSGGQRQRIAIARAAIRNAPFLILDEPTTGLDEENERSVLESLQRLSRGRTTFWITHDLDLAARADLILYFEGGRILEQGSHRELMSNGGRYAALYSLRASGALSEASEPLAAVAGE
jgi:ATP-binding cassette subfamily B protein